MCDTRSALELIGPSDRLEFAQSITSLPYTRSRGCLERLLPRSDAKTASRQSRTVGSGDSPGGKAVDNHRRTTCGLSLRRPVAWRLSSANTGQKSRKVRTLRNALRRETTQVGIYR
jgi:hypothetical protein